MQAFNVNKKQQNGIALIMVLLVVALVTIITTGIASNQKLNHRRTSNLLHNEQAYMYLLGAEDWAKDILIEDIDPKNNNTKNNPDNYDYEDSSNDIWNRGNDGVIGANIVIPIDNGKIIGKIYDLQARFNLNNIITVAAPPAVSTPNPLNVTALRNLMIAVDSGQNNVTMPTQTDAIVDWIDGDQNALTNGAEDGEYLNRKMPYVAANRLMANARELILVNEFNNKVYEVLEPYVVALPEPTPLNINTAERIQFRMLIPGISDNDLDAVINARGTEGFSKRADFTGLSEVPNSIDPLLFDVRSRYFLLAATVTQGKSVSRLYSIIRRESLTDIKVILRSQYRITETT